MVIREFNLNYKSLEKCPRKISVENPLLNMKINYFRNRYMTFKMKLLIQYVGEGS